MKNLTWKSYPLIFLMSIFLSSAIAMAEQVKANDNEEIVTFYTEKARKNIYDRRYVLAEQDINDGLEKIKPKIIKKKCPDQEECQNKYIKNNALLAKLFSIRALSREFRGLDYAAISDYEKSLKYSQNFVDTKYSLAILYAKHHRNTEAISLYHQIEKVNPDRARSLKQQMDTLKSVRDLLKDNAASGNNRNNYR